MSVHMMYVLYGVCTCRTGTNLLTYLGGGGTVFRGDNLGSGKCIFYRGVLSH